jgi:hypothetical protein
LTGREDNFFYHARKLKSRLKTTITANTGHHQPTQSTHFCVLITAILQNNYDLYH